MLRARQRLVLLVAVVLIAAPASANAQGLPVTTRDVTSWFDNQIQWVWLLGVIIGAAVGALYLARLRVTPGDLEVDGRARKLLFVWGIVFVIGVAGALLFSASQFVPLSSGGAGLSFTEALKYVWWSGYTCWLLVVTFACYVVGAAIAMRVKPHSRCPYAMFPGPRPS